MLMTPIYVFDGIDRGQFRGGDEGEITVDLESENLAAGAWRMKAF